MVSSTPSSPYHILCLSKDSSYSNSCNTGKADLWNSQVMWISTIALSIQSETSVPRRHSFLRVVLLTGPQAKSRLSTDRSDYCSLCFASVVTICNLNKPLITTNSP
ncbi:hypothetical protein T4A_8854 [Trichinella pseudospiralis]|uniref:Uncharacterized protein n=1 Tax=Trichinella pseudospiralis TaxID=6337 RepID=A0A0V1E888_TRIPS|nr:hypothetical protein T4A_8854 [Trichinella pseudospiralis]